MVVEAVATIVATAVITAESALNTDEVAAVVATAVAYTIVCAVATVVPTT